MIRNLKSFDFNSTVGGTYNIECKIWAKNIVYDSQRRLGLARFELFIE